jgi:hypothetical protein
MVKKNNPDKSTNSNKKPKGSKLIFRASKTLEDGKKIFARDYGLKGFPIWIN